MSSGTTERAFVIDDEKSPLRLTSATTLTEVCNSRLFHSGQYHCLT